MKDGGTPDAPTAAETRETISRIEGAGDFVVDAALIGELLNVPVAEVPALMRNKGITGICETGIDADQGTFRLNLFHGGRHAKLRIDAKGRILRRSVIDFGERPATRSRRRPLQSSPRDASR